MRQNAMKQKLMNGRDVWGVFMQLPSPELVEVSALLGYDFVVIDCEHGAISEDMAAHMIRAADAANLTPIVRVPRNEAPTILRYLDRGAQGIMVPQVNSRAEAERAAMACRYFPDGRRGIAPNRAVDYGLARAFKDALADVNREVLVIVQLEHASGVERIEEIATTQGVDVVFIGPGDLSQSLGKPVQFDAPEVQAAIARVIGVCTQVGTAVGIYPGDGDNARRYAGLGATVQAIGDIALFVKGARAFIEQVTPSTA